jgi:RNA polymerase sigma-70 factor, ECF subfamily
VYYAWRVTDEPADAEDAAQAAIIKMFESGVFFQDWESARILGYARVAAYRCAIDSVRRRKPGISLPLVEGELQASAEAEQILQRLDAEKYLGQLPEEDRVMLKMVGDGYTTNEVADVLEIEASAARVRLFRLRKRLEGKRFDATDA